MSLNPFDWRNSYISGQIDTAGAGSRDKNTGKRKGGDWLGDIIFGVDQDDYAGVKETRRGVSLEEKYGDTGIADQFGVSLTNEDGSYRPTSQITQDITRVKENKDLIRGSSFSAAELGVDPLTASYDQISSAIRLRTEERRDEELKPERDLAEGKLALLRQQAKDSKANSEATLQLQREQGQQRDALNRHELKVKQIEAQNERALRKWEAQGKRDDAKMQLMMQMQTNQLNRQYQRERDERADARADKKERQMMVMQLVKGLTNMGQAFAL